MNCLVFVIYPKSRFNSFELRGMRTVYRFWQFRLHSITYLKSGKNMNKCWESDVLMIAIVEVVSFEQIIKNY